MENRIYKLSDEEFKDLVKSSLNISEVLFKLNYSTKGNSWGYSQVKQRMADLNLSGYDFKGKAALSVSNKKVDPEKLFCKNSKHNRNVLRKTIIRDNLLPYKCAICGEDGSKFRYGLAIDHNHKTNKVRELLCPFCNTAIGSLKEDPVILLKAIDYINKHNL